jgi:hypothetical protein
MRYLKTYKIFESIDVDIRLDIRDIILELEDLGIQCTIKDTDYYKDNTNVYPCIRVSIFKYLSRSRWGEQDNGSFVLEDITEVLLRIKYYLKETEYHIDIEQANTDKYYPIDVFMKKFRGQKLSHIYLYIYKQ